MSTAGSIASAAFFGLNPGYQLAYAQWLAAKAALDRIADEKDETPEAPWPPPGFFDAVEFESQYQWMADKPRGAAALTVQQTLWPRMQAVMATCCELPIADYNRAVREFSGYAESRGLGAGYFPPGWGELTEAQYAERRQLLGCPIQSGISWGKIALAGVALVAGAFIGAWGIKKIGKRKKNGRK